MDRFVVRKPAPKRKQSQVAHQADGEVEHTSAPPAERSASCAGSSPPLKCDAPTNKRARPADEGEEAETKQPPSPALTPASERKVLGSPVLPPGVAARWHEHDGEMEVSMLLDGGVFRRYPRFLAQEQASALFDSLMNNVPWTQSDIKVYGKTYKSPRLQCWMADSLSHDKASLYLQTEPTPWSDEVLAIKTRLEDLLGCKFDYLLLNLYRNGRDYISFHADREAIPEGKGVIASLSLGAKRRFVLKHNSGATLEYPMSSGSLMVMDGQTQKTWKHSVPKEARVTQPRINLTFRIS